ncbi:hypothetical protein TNIN_239751 [Trichonephila inaurata madagascariensis]|uniref:Uncharacterized protein n=1 Tax=Trichonephila inaurata madagascariensis TaxID=2747483 RepID=A0A8X6X3T9_9ARAC|nr:hypothetical protein TNIN_239751 [Trichonephila inaurata madagascariensis]
MESIPTRPSRLQHTELVKRIFFISSRYLDLPKQKAELRYLDFSKTEGRTGHPDCSKRNLFPTRPSRLQHTGLVKRIFFISSRYLDFSKKRRQNFGLSRLQQWNLFLSRPSRKQHPGKSLKKIFFISSQNILTCQNRRQNFGHPDCSNGIYSYQAVKITVYRTREKNLHFFEKKEHVFAYIDVSDLMNFTNLSYDDSNN